MLLISLEGMSDEDLCFLAGGELLRSFLIATGNKRAPDLMRHFSNSLFGLINFIFSTVFESLGLSANKQRSCTKTT